MCYASLHCLRGEQIWEGECSVLFDDLGGIVSKNEQNIDARRTRAGSSVDGELAEFDISEEEYSRIFEKVTGKVPPESVKSQTKNSGTKRKVHNSRDRWASALLSEFNKLLKQGKRPNKLVRRIEERAANIGKIDHLTDPDN